MIIITLPAIMASQQLIKEGDTYETSEEETDQSSKKEST